MTPQQCGRNAGDGDAISSSELRGIYARSSAPPPNTVVREALELLKRRGRFTLGTFEQQGLMRCYQRTVAPADS
jgi:hypothetical protein